jgi:hypothetical protein
MAESNTLGMPGGPRRVNQRVEIAGNDALDPFLGATSPLSTEFPSRLFEFTKGMYRKRVGGMGASTLHENDPLQLRQIPLHSENLGKNGLVLHKGQDNPGMGKDVSDLLAGDIGGAGHIRGGAELDSGIRQNPLKTVVGKYGDVIPRADPQ